MAKPRVLLLGAGLVSRPIVRYLLDQAGFRVHVASLYLEDAQRLVAGHPNGEATTMDVSDDNELGPAIEKSDLVVSLVPYAFHPRVAKHCIQHRKPMVTASYVSDEMRALDGPARDADILLLNEIGLDPGLDHMSAILMIRRVQAAGEKIVSFESCAGGLPAPDSASAPWRYKFSWSPRGVLLAGLNDARFLEDGRVVDVPSPDYFDRPHPYEVEGVGLFEMYPNRDSTGYIDRYGLQGIQRMLRGTIRFPGWCSTMATMVRLGLLNDDKQQAPQKSWAAHLDQLLEKAAGKSLKERLIGQIDSADAEEITERLEAIGLLDDQPFPTGTLSSLDRLAQSMMQHLAYGQDERDMILLRHELHSERADGTRLRHLSLLVDHGIADGDSAMSRTVSLPAAVAAERILDGTISLKGVQVPSRQTVAGPVMERLAELGIAFREWTEELS